MNLLTTVLIVFVVLVILYYIISWLTSKSVKLTHIIKGTNHKHINAKKLKTNHSSNFTFSVWFYVDDWSQGYNSTKNLLVVNSSNSAPGVSGNVKPLEIDFGRTSNDIHITTQCYGGKKSGGETAKCQVQNFPLQKWVCLIVSVYGRTLDAYIDGKLVKTCILPGTVMMNKLTSLDLTPNGGFSGMTAELRYWASASNPQQAYNIYASGFGGMGSDFFNKYKLRVSFLEDNKVEGSFEI